MPGQDLDSSSIRLVNVFKVRREKEHEQFTQTVFNTRYLFHGSRMGAHHATFFTYRHLVV